jgi:hypothetical protein
VAGARKISTEMRYATSHCGVMLTDTSHQNTATCSGGFQGAQQSPDKETSSCLEADTWIMGQLDSSTSVMGYIGRKQGREPSPLSLSSLSEDNGESDADKVDDEKLIAWPKEGDNKQLTVSEFGVKEGLYGYQA